MYQTANFRQATATSDTPKFTAPLRAMLLVTTALTLVACQSAATASPPPKSPVVAIPNAQLYDNILTGGRPSHADYTNMAAAGFKTIVDLRPETEAGATEDAHFAQGLGLNVVRIPVAGAADLTRKNATDLDAVLAAADGPIAVHCASGNRAGALFALRAAWLQGKSAEEALAIGRQTGLTKLADAVTALLTSAQPAP